jgi:hypothetical protein
MSLGLDLDLAKDRDQDLLRDLDLDLDLDCESVGGNLKVHKIENFFGSEFEFYTSSLLVMLKS